jgi:nicotinate phosphoribosyltransferase
MSGDSFLISNDEEIKNAKTTDVYFVRTKKILEYYNVKKRVWAEFTVSSPPYPVVVFGGIRQVVKLLEGIPVNLYGIEEGVLFPSQDERGVLIPVLAIEGEYKEFCEYETPILGFICHASGILTKAFRLKKCAGEAICLSFGIRRMHPALAPFIDFYSYMGGCDGVSSLKGAESIGDSPKGTMPHSLIILLGEEKAWEAFDKIISPEIPRIALIDTYGDEKVQAIRATQVVKNIKGVRLDTPSSRRGDMKKIVQEIRWELDIRGRKEVMIFVSGGLDEKEILDLTKAGAQGFGVVQLFQMQKQLIMQWM